MNAFVEWLDEEEGIGCCDTNIVRTTEPAANFIDSAVDYTRVRTASMGDLPITIIEGHQLVKGWRRCDVYVLEAAEGVSLVYR